MSAGAEVVALTPGSLRRAPAPARPSPAQRPIVRLGAFAALGFYGVLRWGTMLSPAPVWRLLGLLALGVLIAGAGPALREIGRPLAILAAVAAALAALALAGIPFAWIEHVRIAVTSNAVGQGLSALPQLLVPYTGINEWARVTIVLGAGVLLLDAGVMLAFAPRPLGELRRAGAALPLVALAVVPSTLSRPALPYVHGLILFALLAAFMWGERVRRYDVAIGVAGVAGAAAMVAAPALDQHSPWLNYQALASSLSPRPVATFDWSQRYGPLRWPRTGRAVLDVQAQHPDYWKAVDLDVFNGVGWTPGYAVGGAQAPPPDAAELTRWTQTIQVTVRAMRTTDVIAAGFATAPLHISQPVGPGLAPGTWRAGGDLAAGASYRVSTYSPQPSPAALAAAGSDYPPLLLSGYRSIWLSGTAATNGEPAVVFPPFHSRLAVQSVIGLAVADGTALVQASPYQRAFALARRLARQAPTPYAFVASVESWLAHGYTYDENPPASRYPLPAFLFKDKLGYCQQFSGAMALLLRMGGVPARVAAGFTSGSYDGTTHRWIVSDLDAHAWVEAWFPHYGWVRFDPTPAAAPARGGNGQLPARDGAFAPPAPKHPVRRAEPTPAAARGAASTPSGGPPTAILGASIVALLGLLALLMHATRRSGDPTGEPLLRELVRALARCGRPISDGVTLSALEHRFRASPGAAGYVRTLRLARFAGSGELPTAAQRRALRAQLRQGLGALGRPRALWALPPRRSPRPGHVGAYTPTDERRLRAVPSRDRVARGRPPPPGDDPALPGPRSRPRQDLDS